MSELGPRFAERAAKYDANDTFVTENFAELKGRGVFAAGVPKKLGGGGASYRELCDMLRVLAVLRFDSAYSLDALASRGDGGLALATRSQINGGSAATRRR